MKVGIIMDPVEGINIRKDSSFAMLLAAQSRDWEIFYMKTENLFLDGNNACADMQKIRVFDNPEHWFDLTDTDFQELAGLDVIFMRKDPPVGLEYIYATYILEIAKQHGVMIINDPQALRDVNEKIFILNFPDCIAPSLVTCKKNKIISFLNMHKDIILKPLNAMGGHSVFRIQSGDKNTNVIIESMTNYEKHNCMIQKYIPEIVDGDKRILIINGQPVPYALARVPNINENRANLVMGGTAKSVPLSDNDKWICDQLKPELIKRGLFFTGIDVIGDYLTEVNVTSPTCIRELDSLCELNIADQMLSDIENIISELN